RRSLWGDVIRQSAGSAGALPGAAPIGTAHSTTKRSAPCGSRRATGQASTHSSVNGGVMCQIVSRPAGREARSPGLSISVGPPAISMATSPWSTWIVSRWDGVHGLGPSTEVNRVRPAHTPVRTNELVHLAAGNLRIRLPLPGPHGRDEHTRMRLHH